MEGQSDVGTSAYLLAFAEKVGRQEKLVEILLMGLSKLGSGSD